MTSDIHVWDYGISVKITRIRLRVHALLVINDGFQVKWQPFYVEFFQGQLSSLHKLSARQSNNSFPPPQPQQLLEEDEIEAAAAAAVFECPSRGSR